jgi:hypothetical protein
MTPVHADDHFCISGEIMTDGHGARFHRGSIADRLQQNSIRLKAS